MPSYGALHQTQQPFWEKTLVRRSTRNVARGTTQGLAYVAPKVGQLGTDIIKGYGAAVRSPMAGYLTKAALSPIKPLMTLPGSYVAFGGIGAVMAYDATKNAFASHMAQEGVKLGADIAYETALFSTVGRLGMYGMATALGVSMLGHMTGLNPGAMVGRLIDKASDKYRREMGMGPKPITQNERTMKATQQGLSLLGQSSRGHSMLGYEAQFMHN